MQVVCDRDPTAYSHRSDELAYLGNVILAGCSIQARPFTRQEASDAAVAVCNLGLENWPSHWYPGRSELPDDLLIALDLVSLFQVGWTVLQREVCLYTAEQLVTVLQQLRSDDHYIQAGLDRLSAAMARQQRNGTPWRAHDDLDVITMLDMPTWAALLGLTGECPVMHAAMDASRVRRTHAVSASDFEFISENSQIRKVHDFLQSLPKALSG